MFGLCKYRHVFGREGEGVHSMRLFNIAVVDLVLTIVAAIAISYYTKLNLLVVLVGLFALAIVIHRAFCVNTTINKTIFGVL